MNPMLFPDERGNPLLAAGEYINEAAGRRRGEREARNERIGNALLQSWPAEMARVALDAAALPGDVYAGRVDPMSDEGIGRSAELAGMLTLGSGAIPAGRGELRMGAARRGGKPQNADEYIQAVGGKRVAAEDRPNLGMGDMYGMAPRGARPVARLDGGDLGPVRIVQDGENFYALAHNPDLGETDVVGYIMNRGDGTELAVVQEAQGRGIGSELSYRFRSNNPMAPSGGFTEAGERAARRTYERLKREGRI